ncbi:hypothetical protein [Wenzhouxiangella marina]|uniref:Uncharacterized protein n=1 Tax=Wenzhouxiangella marina TaxID=1579979 RepID=A0A0K0XWG5_9GAMM|nr:hypothetical protein [Wenzhouxiangella marina]AKS42044.1 hypothetical protein WM2015_1674 [Wenzhouxiangella marina]MBB6086188.1 hypothetical protein [Wenzhouxiangella marina]
MKKAVLTLLVLAPLAIAGLYWQTHAKVTGQLERIGSALMPFGQLSWGSVFIDPRGSVRIGSIAFQLHDESDRLLVDEIDIDAGSLGALLALSREFSEGRIPQQARITIAGLRLPLLEPLNIVPISRSGLVLPLFAAGCTEFESASLYDLSDLDYWTLTADATLVYRLESDRIFLDSRLNVAGFSLTEQHWELDVPASPGQFSELVVEIPRAGLRHLNYSFTDRGFIERLNHYCSRSLGLSERDWHQRHLDAWTGAWAAAGAAPGSLTVAGYRHFISTPGARLTLDLQTDAPLPLAQLLELSPASLVDRLQPSFSINEGTDIQMSASAVDVPPPSEQERVSESPPEPNEAQTATLRAPADDGFEEREIRVGPAPEWQGISVSQIALHHGDRVRLRLSDGQEFQGRIIDSDGETLQLLTRSRSGEFARPIRMADIEFAEVRPW